MQLHSFSRARGRDGAEARAVTEGSGPGIHLLVTDMVLTDGNGRDVARRVVDALGRDIRLRITPADALANFIGEKLTLHFERSRRLDFVVESLAGTCAASGDLYALGRLPILGTPRKQRNLFAFGLS